MTRLFLFDGVRCGCQCYWIYHTPAMIMYIFQMNKISLTSDSDYIVHKESLGISFFFCTFQWHSSTAQKSFAWRKKEETCFPHWEPIPWQFSMHVFSFHFIIYWFGFLQSINVLACVCESNPLFYRNNFYVIYLLKFSSHLESWVRYRRKNK